MEAHLPISPSTSAALSLADSTQANKSLFDELANRVSAEKLTPLMQKHNRRSVSIRDDDHFFRALLDGLDASDAVINMETNLETVLEPTLSRLDEETLKMDERRQSLGLRIRLAMPMLSLTLDQADSLTEGVQHPTTIHGNAHLLFVVADLVAKCSSDVVDEPFLDREAKIGTFNDVGEPVLDRPQECSQPYQLAATGAALQPASRKQKQKQGGALTREQSETGWKTKLRGKTKEKNKMISKVRKSERIASQKSSMTSTRIRPFDLCSLYVRSHKSSLNPHPSTLSFHRLPLMLGPLEAAGPLCSPIPSSKDAMEDTLKMWPSLPLNTG